MTIPSDPVAPLSVVNAAGPPRWVTPTVLAIVAATFLSDFSHEMCTAVLPLYLASMQLGPAALGLIEGIADFLVSLSKLGGGYLGHHVREKRPWASLGYLITAGATFAIALVTEAVAILTLRSLAWIGRGFRGPLRDAMLAEAVPREYFGRAYGLERAGDMLGAVAGPLVAILLVWAGLDFRTVILWTLLPGLAAAAAIYFFARERQPVSSPVAPLEVEVVRPKFPSLFWWFLGGVLLFGLGDFSRTFLIWLAAKTLGEEAGLARGTLSLAVTLYLGHNLISAAAAYPTGYLGDHFSKAIVLIVGYGLGVLTNLSLAIFFGSFSWLVVTVLLSGVYIAVEETLEKAVAAELLPKELRSLGFGILACVNAVGDMVSSVYVGYLLQSDQPGWAFGLAAGVGAAGVLWMVCLVIARRKPVVA
jgi:MFS family permease